MELAEAFCEQARVRVDDLFDHLWRNADDSDGRLARSVLADRFTWLEEGGHPRPVDRGPVDRPAGQR